MRGKKYRTVTYDVRQILLAEWDPLGIRDEPAAQSEYDCYIPNIASAILSDEATPDLARRLIMIEIETMGLKGNEQRASVAAQKLLNLGRSRL